MRDFVKVSQTVWKSKKFKGLANDNCRFMYLYILTCPHSNSPGCFDLPYNYIASDLNWVEGDVMASINALCAAGLIQYDDETETVLIENWFEFNSPTNPKHAVGMFSQLKQASSDVLRETCGKMIKAEVVRKQFDREQIVRKAMETFFIPYRKGIITETETETKTERETETKTCEEVRSATPRLDAAEGRVRLASQGEGPSQALLAAAKRMGAIQ